MHALLLVALLTPAHAEECNRACEPRLQDVFGCCPSTPLSSGRVGARPDRGVAVVALEPAPGTTRRLQAMKTEVSQALYQAVTGTAPAAHLACGGACPVERVSWCDAVAFANRLSAREWLTPAYRLPAGFRPGMDAAACDLAAASVEWNPEANGWRLPTEAEWERVAALDPGAPPPEPGRGAEGRTGPACDGRTDRQGVCDALGGVWEWTWDPDPEGGATRAARGCSFRCAPEAIRADARTGLAPGLRDDATGFRLVRSDQAAGQSSSGPP